jgi:hypothetical protein
MVIRSVSGLGVRSGGVTLWLSWRLMFTRSVLMLTRLVATDLTFGGQCRVKFQASFFSIAYRAIFGC